jgi:hypothetical protein
MKVVRISETSVYYETKRCYIPEGCGLQAQQMYQVKFYNY